MWPNFTPAKAISQLKIYMIWLLSLQNDYRLRFIFPELYSKVNYVWNKMFNTLVVLNTHTYPSFVLFCLVQVLKTIPMKNAWAFPTNRCAAVFIIHKHPLPLFLAFDSQNKEKVASESFSLWGAQMSWAPQSERNLFFLQRLNGNVQNGWGRFVSCTLKLKT